MGEQSQVKPPLGTSPCHSTVSTSESPGSVNVRGVVGPSMASSEPSTTPHTVQFPFPDRSPTFLMRALGQIPVSHGASRERITTKAGPEDSPGVPESGLVPTHDAANSVPISPPAMTHGRRPPRFMDRSLIGDGFLVKERTHRAKPRQAALVTDQSFRASRAVSERLSRYEAKAMSTSPTTKTIVSVEPSRSEINQRTAARNAAMTSTCRPSHTTGMSYQRGIGARDPIGQS